MQKNNPETPQELTTNQLLALGAGALVLVFILFGGQIREGLGWVSENSNAIKHVLIAGAILFGGVFISTKTSTNFDQSFSQSQLWLLIAVVYLAVVLGIPALKEAFSSSTQELFKIR